MTNSLRVACFLTLLSLVAAESVHWQWREIVCKGREGKDIKEATPCSIRLHESENDPDIRDAPLDTCFPDTVDGTARTYCDILCPGAATAYRITRSPQNNKSCFSHITYRLERREDNFFLWRSGKCLTDDISFTVRCEFSSARASYPPDDVLFEGARRRLALLRR